MSYYNRLRPFTQTEACECDQITGLLLVYILTRNPIHCIQCKNEIDPERLKLSAKMVDKIADWNRAYGSLYELWLDSGEYEIWAEQKLLDPKGQGNTQGMAIVKELSDQWPTYFWWFDDAAMDGEATFCPNCGEKLSEETIFEKKKCKPCRIIV